MFWIREIAGWALVVLGLWLFYVSYFVLLKSHHIVESGPTVLMGLIVFRGGIHLLKVAVAARVCRQAPVEAKVLAVRPEAQTAGRPPVGGPRAHADIAMIAPHLPASPVSLRGMHLTMRVPFGYPDVKIE